mgnify:FL=1
MHVQGSSLLVVVYVQFKDVVGEVHDSFLVRLASGDHPFVEQTIQLSHLKAQPFSSLVPIMVARTPLLYPQTCSLLVSSSQHSQLLFEVLLNCYRRFGEIVLDTNSSFG